MTKIGDYNTLIIEKITDHGYYLKVEEEDIKRILLPYSSVENKEMSIGDEITVFIYRDSSDRLIATTKQPLAKVGEISYLKVVSNTKIGAFVDFGLERDILVPMKERAYLLEENKKYLFYIYLDKTGRIAATTYIDKYLSDETEYKIGDEVSGIIYGFQTNGSAMIAVDNKFRGVILKNEYFDRLITGEMLNLRVIKIYEDKIGLTPRKGAVIEKTVLEDTILQYLKSHDGFMPYNDKSSPDEIYRVFHESKNYFKNTLGALMKKRLITQDVNGTKMVLHSKDEEKK